MKEAVIIGVIVLVGAASDKLSDRLNPESFIRWILRNWIPHICFWAAVIFTVFFMGRFIFNRIF